jgi:hypothetical protein
MCAPTSEAHAETMFPSIIETTSPSLGTRTTNHVDRTTSAFRRVTLRRQPTVRRRVRRSA